MTMLQAIVLGVIQGLTEFLPISSSGHLILVPEVFGWEAGGLAFDTMVHVATFLAVLFVFRDAVWKMGLGMLGKKEHLAYRKVGWMVLVATIPVVAVGLWLGESETLRTTWVVAVSLIVWGVVLAIADVVSRKQQKLVRTDAGVTWKQTLFIGFAQVLALIPGTSRSGITMSAGLFAGLDRTMATRVSFLLSLPAVGGAAAYVVLQAIQAGETLWTPELFAGFVAAFLSGIAAMSFLLRVVEKWSFMPFAVYRVLLGLVLLLWFV